MSTISILMLIATGLVLQAIMFQAMERDVLAVLKSNGKMRGREIIKATKCCGRGIVYVVLYGLETRGVVSSAKQNQHRVYWIPKDADCG